MKPLATVYQKAVSIEGVDKKVIKKIKDETEDQEISHFSANRAKSYSCKIDRDETRYILKGLVKCKKYTAFSRLC